MQLPVAITVRAMWVAVFALTIAACGSSTMLGKQPGGSGGSSGMVAAGGTDVAAGGTDVAAGGTAAPGSCLVWEPRAPMPTPRSEFGTVVLDGLIYTIGGTVGTAVNIVEVYDPASNTWSARASMPTSRQKMVAAASGGLIYVIGGFAENSGSVAYTNVTEIYDPRSDSWSADETAPPIPAIASNLRGNQFIAGAAVGDDIYVAVLRNALFKYTPTTHTWSELPAWTVNPVNPATAAVVDNKLYLLDALESMMGYGAALIAFDVDRGGWFSYTSLARQANARPAFQALAAAHGSLYAVGGADYLADGNPPSVTGRVFRWTPEANTWTEDTPLPSPRHTIGLATVDDVIYAIGGSRDPWYTTVPVGDVSAGRDTANPGGSCGAGGAGGTAGAPSAGNGPTESRLVWEPRASMPTPRSEFGAVVLDGLIYTIGGTVGTAVNFVEVYDPAGNTWSTRASMPTSRQKMVAAASGGLIYVIGGFADNSGSVAYTNVTEIYDPTSDSWTADETPPPIPAAVNNVRGNQFIAGAAVGDDIYLAALDNPNPLFKYTPATHTWSELPAGILTRNPATAAVLDNKLYLLDALESRMGYAAALTAFDVDRGVWFAYTSLARQADAATAFQALVAAHGALYAVGGSDYLSSTPPPSATGRVFRWTPEANAWTEDTPLPSPRHTIGLATVDDVIYAIGGSRDPWYTTVPVGDVSAGRYSATPEP